MARKSRKETAAVAVQEADAACRAAIYVRLSVEDTHTHSVSIETQQMIIARYLEQYPEISVYDTYIDNGATGTNFHRPGFQQMLSDIAAGHVNCVIVKDPVSYTHLDVYKRQLRKQGPQARPGGHLSPSAPGIAEHHPATRDRGDHRRRGKEIRLSLIHISPSTKKA